MNGIFNEEFEARLHEKAGKSVFFIGIGGVSMSSLAHITQVAGLKTGGSDRTESEVTDRLEKEGIEIFYRHDGKNVEGYDLVVYTAAIPEDNPEMTRAKELDIKTMSRAEYLGLLMLSYKNKIGVAGTHGKSTVTSMLADIFTKAECNPTVLSGAEMTTLGGYYRIGGNEHFIFEACEYKDSFLSFFPSTAVITNIEYDHSDYFKTFEQLIGSFDKYCEIADNAVLNFDDRQSYLLAKRYGKNVIGYAIESSEAEYRAANIEIGSGHSAFDILHNGEKLVRITLSVPGRHNIYDALASAVTAFSYGISPEAVRKALEEFRSAKRRFEYAGNFGGADIYSDYAHHPSEIKATLTAAKEVANGRNVICVFQPHTYTRTKAFFDGFAESLKIADKVILADIYAAREQDIYNISSKMLSEKIPSSLYIGNISDIAEYLKNSIGENDIVVVTGAGDIIKLLPLLGLSCN